MDATPPAGLRPGQPVRVTGRGHLSRCGNIAFFVDGDRSSVAEVWVDFGDRVVMPVDRCMIEPIAPTDQGQVIDPVAGGLAALRTSWPAQPTTRSGKSDG